MDIVTSQKELSIRDSKEPQNIGIYNALGISVSHCINEENKKEKNCYDKDVIYDDIHNFQSDFLYDKYHQTEVRNNRKCDIIIVDEIDSMFTDEYGKSTLLANNKFFMSRLNFFIILMWLCFPKNNSVEDCKNNKKKIEENNEEFVNKIITRKNDYLSPPKIEYLNKYIKQDVKRLVDRSLDAFIMDENVKYQVKPNKEKINIVIPIDNESTGTILNNTNLSHGLHQFLELKSKCKLTTMNLISSFLSNYRFFKLYRNDEINNIYGLTGTLCFENVKDLLDKI